MKNRHRIPLLPLRTILFGLSVFFMAGCSSAPAAEEATLSPTSLPSAAPAADRAEYWPTDGWRTSTPEEQGMNGEMLERMIDNAQAQKMPLQSLLVIRNGYIVSESYFTPREGEMAHEIYSVTKSFVSTLVGIAVDQGKIDRIDRPMLEFFPGIDFENPDPRKERMTLEDVLTMRTGLEWSDTDPYFNAIFQSADWVKYMLDLPMAADPGTAFNYCSGCSHLLSAVVQAAAGKSARDYAEENLFRPLGMRDVYWASDPNGISIGGWGLALTPREMAKLGYLFLTHGEWDGRQIVSAEWVGEATRKHTATDGTLGYGYQWWTYPSWGAYAALGRDGQTIFVIPDENIIVVTTAAGAAHDRIFLLIEQYVHPAILR